MDCIYSSKFKEELEKTIRGYHMVSDAPIKEAVWESIMSQTLKRCDCENTWKLGGHESGRDIVIAGNGISCKSSKQTAKAFKISSYRMTTLSSSEEFVKEIDVNRNNFTHYCVLARSENAKSITYGMYMIPSDRVKAGEKSWSEQKNKKGNTSMWKTDSENGYEMTVSVPMGNQLWVTLQRATYDEYLIVKDVIVAKGNATDYASLFDRLSLGVS